MPLVVLIVAMNYWTKRRTISIGLNFILGIVFIAIGLIISFYAMLVSMKGMTENNITYVTGASIFLFFGFLIYLFSIPMILLFFYDKRKV